MQLCPCAAVIIGVVAAYLQIAGVITVIAAFLWVVLGIAIVYLAVLVLAAALARSVGNCGSGGSVLNLLLTGIPGTILFGVVLLAAGVVATSVVSAIPLGSLLIFFTLTVTGTACCVKCLSDSGT